MLSSRRLSRSSAGAFALSMSLLAACGILATACSGDDGDEADVALDSGDMVDVTPDTDAALDARDTDAVDALSDSDVQVEDTAPDVDEPLDGSGDSDTGDAQEDPDDADAPDTCGDGRVDPGEECDDGNNIDTDACTNACTVARCGDGVRDQTIGVEVFESPRTTNPGGAVGNVCDDGATCPGLTCSVDNVPSAPEHGICQGLGYQRAISVTWGGGDGAGDAVVLHADNWVCFDYICVPGRVTNTEPNCEDYEMLSRIECEGLLGEACDDGDLNGDFPDACRADCSLPFCGDGVTDSGEQCDGDDGDRMCRADCTLPFCGDGRLDPGEACDDGNDNDLDACRNTCGTPFCGDGVISEYERVDVFTTPTVRNPARASGRVCDEGASCARGTCNVSGNGRAPEHGICQSLGYERAVVASWGGNIGVGDSVTPRASNWSCENFECEASPNQSSAGTCGAGRFLTSIVCSNPTGEQCDDGADNSDVEPGACRTNCLQPDCGDGIVAGTEECDDGNRVAADGCTNFCTLPSCGDGVLQEGEECDDANSDDVDLCRNDCVLARCGDGFVSRDEECDFGDDNSEEPDARCRTNCQFAGCGDGVIDPGESCDDANDVNDDLCSNACRFAICGDGILQRVLGEECDDGNRAGGDGCDAVCLRDASGLAGFAFYIGHDFFATTTDTEALIGNAVLGNTRSPVTDVLAYRQFADRNSTGEVARVDGALERYADAASIAYEIRPFDDYEQLEEELVGADVLMIYEQERNGPMTVIGEQWAEPLRSFLSGGGRVIIMDFSGGTWQLADAAGIFPITGLRSVSTSTPLQIFAPELPLFDDVSNPYPASNGTTAVVTSEPAYIVVGTSDSSTGVGLFRAY